MADLVVGRTMDLVRAPRDKLFTACVIGASLVYVGFLVAMQLAPKHDESLDARQGFIGMVGNQSQSGGSGDPDPAEALVEVGNGRTPAHVAGGGSPGPIVLVQTNASSSTRGAGSDPRGAPLPYRPTHVRAVVSGPISVIGGSGPSMLVVDRLVITSLEQALALVEDEGAACTGEACETAADEGPPEQPEPQAPEPSPGAGLVETPDEHDPRPDR